jgi:hypothetical protein
MKDENGGSLILPPDRIKKIIVRDEANGDEIRPEADVEMFRNSVFEFPAIWPDCNPLPSWFP